MNSGTVPREVVEASSLEIFKLWLDECETWFNFESSIALKGRLDRVLSKVSLQPKLFYDFYFIIAPLPVRFNTS